MTPARTPLFSSAESAECGLACVAMIAAHHGHQTNLAGLRRSFGLSASGARLRDLMQILDALGFEGRPVKLDMEGLQHLALPAILHWNLDHFVVLDRCERGRYRILDPAAGELLLSDTEVSLAFTGVALEVRKAAGFAPQNRVLELPFARVWSAVEGWRMPAVQILGLAVVLQLIALAGPVGTQILIDEAVLAGDLSFMSILVGGLAALAVLQVLFELVRAWSTETLRQRIAYQLTGAVVRHLLRLPASFFERRSVADIVSRVQSSWTLRDVVTKSGIDVIVDCVMGTTLLIAILIYSPLLTAVILAGVALQATVFLLTFPPLRRRMERQITALASEQGHLMESLRSASTIKLLGNEVRRESQWRSRFSDVINANLDAARFKLLTNAASGLMTGLRFVVVLGLGASMVINETGFTIGMLYAFLALQQMFSDRATSLLTGVVQLKTLSLHLERMSDILCSEPEAASTAHRREDEIGGHIALSRVSFRYATNGAPVLTDLDLEVNKGEFVAIIGSSGSGKSTLLKILLGLETPTAGAVKVDGIPVEGTHLRAWREAVGCLLQDDRLVSGSIFDNISSFDPDADATQVEAAAKAAQVHADIIRMPMQYSSLVGEMGAALSGGQRQRIMLARALYRRPKVLILDEGTANLDATTESEIADLIAGLPLTRISVSHRPALVRRADRVLVLEEGRLWPGGTAEGLV